MVLPDSPSNSLIFLFCTTVKIVFTYSLGFSDFNPSDIDSLLAFKIESPVVALHSQKVKIHQHFDRKNKNELGSMTMDKLAAADATDDDQPLAHRLADRLARQPAQPRLKFLPNSSTETPAPSTIESSEQGAVERAIAGTHTAEHCT